MKWINKLLTVVVLSIFWAVPFMLLWFGVSKIGIEPVKYIPLLYLTFLITSLFYKKTWSFETFKTKKGTVKFLSFFIIIILAAVYLNTSVYRSYDLYKYIVAGKKRGWEGRAHQTDDSLGFKPIANARAFHTFPIGDKTPMAYDGSGFRIPLTDTTIARPATTDILFLGCSLTYGDGCYAEQTFPYQVAKPNNLSYINAGVCSYGLSHMLILAQHLIPKYKPRYIVIQYSDWLAGRGVNTYAPTYFGYLPNPYFAEKNDSFILQYPTFKSQVFDLDVPKMKTTYQDHFIRFFMEKGFLFYLKEDWYYQKNRWLNLTGSQLKPASRQSQVEKFAYDKIIQVAKDNNATVIILNLGNIEYTHRSHQLFKGPGILFAEADSTLQHYLQTTSTKDYTREFGLWRYIGKDSILVDQHPNATAHHLIANSIIKVLNEHKD